jgi:hypothetical protein
MTRPKLKQCIMLMSDYSSTGLWNYEGRSTSALKIPISGELVEDISSWVACYEDGFMDGDATYHTYSSYSTKQDIEHYSKWGRRLANRIQVELPDWSVAFFDDKLSEFEYLNDPVYNPDSWGYHIDSDCYNTTNIEHTFDWLEENEMEYAYRWWQREFWFKGEQDATMFTLRWA